MKLKVRLKPEPVEEQMARANLTRSEFASLIGVSAGHLSLLLSGKRFPNSGTRRKLLHAMSLNDAPCCFDSLFEIVGINANRAINASHNNRCGVEQRPETM